MLLKHSSHYRQNCSRSALIRHLPPRSNRSHRLRTEFDISICSAQLSERETCEIVDISFRTRLESGAATVVTAAAGLLATASIWDTAIRYVADEWGRDYTAVVGAALQLDLVTFV